MAPSSTPPVHQHEQLPESIPQSRVGRNPSELATWINERLPELTRKWGVPGASIALGVGDETWTAATGVLNLSTGVPVTPDAIFHIGSITKVFTAALVMHLVDEGRLDLDQTVRSVLSGFTVSDEHAGGTITVRQLLSHSSGFAGDVFTDTGENDDNLERYVAGLAAAQQLFAPGAMFSYSNTGVCVAARIVEVLEECSYEQAMRNRILDPLGLEHASFDANEAILHLAAVGHVRSDHGAQLSPTRTWAMGRSTGSAGARFATRAEDLVTFARTHFSKTQAETQPAMLSTASICEMRRPQIALPDLARGSAWGIGWELWEHGDDLVIGHDGITIGQAAQLRVVPSRGIAVAVLANGGEMHPMMTELTDLVLEELAGIAPQPAPRPQEQAPFPTNPERFIGRYASNTSVIEVRLDDQQRLWMDRTPIGLAAAYGELRYRSELVWWRGDSMLPVTAEEGVHQPVAFLLPDARGRATVLHTGSASTRVD